MKKTRLKQHRDVDLIEKYNPNVLPGLVIDTCEKIRAISEKACAFPIHLL